MDRTQRGEVTGSVGCTVWFTGLSGAGKSTVAHRCERLLVSSGKAAYTLDGDNIRHGLNADLGFSAEDRHENVRRVGEVARLMADAGLIVLAPLISPYQSSRQAIRKIHEAAGLSFLEVYVATPVAVCESRDTKGLYARARSGELSDFTGISSPYEVPIDPDLKIDTSELSIEDAARSVLARLATVGNLWRREHPNT
jgi:bifunctional enzyme CysN/CysC